jgi:FtsP/CotA-like multicopper oxidase with cupredoxin domain
MASYTWALNGQTWPDITPLEVKRGERVDLVFSKQSGSIHTWVIPSATDQRLHVSGMMPTAGNVQRASGAGSTAGGP